MRLIMSTAAAIALMTVAAPPLALAQQPQIAAPAALGTLLTVAADGKTEARPDMATINLGVTTEAETAAAAMAENTRRMNALTAALRRAGVAERDIQTSNISVNPQQQYRENLPPLTTGYQASNSVEAKVRRIDTVGRVIDAAVNAGGNTVNGLYFSYQNPDVQMDAARRNAIEVARTRATLYASALGMRVERVVSVTEGGAAPPPMEQIIVTGSRYGGDAPPPPPPPPVAPGSLETHASLSVTFLLR